MYSILIIDDEGTVAAIERDMVLRHPLSAEFSVACASPDSLVAVDDSLVASPDIVLMDIELGAGEKSGIEFVREHFPQGFGTQVVYVTGHIEYCQDVYQTGHVSFLVKPLQQERLDDALFRAVRKVDERRGSALVLRKGQDVVCIPFDQIESIESKSRKVFVSTSAGIVESYASLAEVEGQLPAGFVRCHKSFLVNMGRVVRLAPDALEMASGARVPVSRRHKAEVRSRFTAYLTGSDVRHGR